MILNDGAFLSQPNDRSSASQKGLSFMEFPSLVFKFPPFLSLSLFNVKSSLKFLT
jgi:hypothetical protein